jgi:hypothetical protein
MPMHNPTKALPQDLIGASQPLHLDLSRQTYDPDAKRQLNLPVITLHIDDAFLLFSLVCTTISATPDIPASFTDAT